MHGVTMKIRLLRIKMQPFAYFSVSYLTKRQTVDSLRSMQLKLKPQATVLEKLITAQDWNQFIQNFIESASSLPGPQNSVTRAWDRTIQSTFWNSFHLIRNRIILQRFLAVPLLWMSDERNHSLRCFNYGRWNLMKSVHSIDVLLSFIDRLLEHL